MARKPLLTYFSESEIEALIEDAFQVLEHTGIYIPNEKAKKILLSAGAKETGKDNLVIPKALVRHVLDNHTPRFKLYSQTGESFLQLEIGNTFYGPGSDLQYIIDIDTNQPRKMKLHDMARNIAILDSLRQYDFLMSTGLPSDVSQEELYKKEFEVMALNSDKPIIATAATLEDVRKAHEIAVRVAGSRESFAEKPFFAAYLEPVSPLKIEGDIADRVMFCAENGIPYLFAAGANIAVQAPGTPEGAVIQGTAESLSGLVLGYLINPNVKFIFGANSADFDGMRGIVSYGGPGWAKTMAYYAEIARRLNMPVWGAAGCSDSNRIDAQSGLEAAMSLLTAELCGSTLVHDVGYLSHGDVADSRNFILNAEIISRVRWMAKRGVIVPGETGAVIDDVARGRAGSFLDTEHTFKRLNSTHHPEEWVERCNYHEGRKLLEKLRKEAYKIWERHEPVVDAEVQAKRSEQKKPAEAIVIKAEEKQKTLEDIFRENPDKPDKVTAFLKQKLDAGESPEELYQELVNSLLNCIEGRILVHQLTYGRRFDDVSGMLTSRISNTGNGTPFVLATVQEDMHYVGKTLTGRLVGMAGYNVRDLGIDVSTGRILLGILEHDANLAGLSALLTGTRENMKKTINALEAVGMKDQVGVIVGGAVLDEQYAQAIRADAYRQNAADAASALDEIKQRFIEKMQHKSADGFFVIGESINSTSKKVKTAIEARDEAVIIKLAEKQVNEGARYIDLAVSHLGDVSLQQEAMRWLVRILQDRFDRPFCFDSDDYRVVQAGFEVYKHGNALINSATLKEERLENMVRLAHDYSSSIVFLASDGKTADSKLDMAERFIDYALGRGIPLERIFIDPGLETMSDNIYSAQVALQTISMLRDKRPELSYTVGLSNIGYGLAEKHIKTRALQQAFVMLGKRVGLNSAIAGASLMNDRLKGREKALSESIEFIVGLTDNIKYAGGLDDTAYGILK